MRPRDAASLVILRGEGARSEVLLGRRAARHRFMPNRFVFPGGRVDPRDRVTAPSRPLRAPVAARLQARWKPSLARGLAVAAVRETYEETGLVFGRLRDGVLEPDLSRLDYIVRAITPPSWPIRFHARFFRVHARHARGVARDSNELRDLRWFPVREALAMPLIDITEFVLRQVERELAGWTPPGVPLFCYRNDKVIVRYE